MAPQHPAALRGVRRPVVIQGFPGVGNVGKIAVDLLVEQIKATKLLSLPIDKKPGFVLVQPDNTVRFPELSFHHATWNRQEFLFLTGEAQPSAEGSIYDVAQELLQILLDVKAVELVTLGGIGFHEPPERPAVYLASADKTLLTKLKKAGADPKVHGVVGPIFGLSGVMLGVAKNKIPTAALLAESSMLPIAMDLRGAEQLLAVLDKAYGFKLDMRALRDSIAAAELMLGHAAGELPKCDETNYIG